MEQSAAPVVIRLSAGSAEELLAKLRALRARAVPLAELADTPDEPAGAERLALVAGDARELAARLDEAERKLAGGARTRLRLRGGVYYGSEPFSGRIAFLFPGQGSQFPDMLRAARARVPQVRAWFDALDRAYARRGATPPSTLLATNERGLYDLGSGAQLGVVASLALLGLVEELGVRADLFVGHSNGEHAALIAADTIRFRDRDALADNLAEVGRALGALPPPDPPEGAVAVSGLDDAALDELVARRPDELYLAMDNCPTQKVLAGRRAAVDEAARAGAARGIWLPLDFERAYHTPLFAAPARLLREHYQKLPSGAPRVPVYSGLTGEPFPSGDADATWALMASQWERPVRFRQIVERLYDEGVRLFVEIGPDAKLTAFVEDSLRRRPHLAVSASSRQRDDLLQLCHFAAELYAAGVAIDWRALRRWSAEPEKISAPAAPEKNPAPRAALDEILTAHRALLREVAESDRRIRRRLGLPDLAAAAAPAAPRASVLVGPRVQISGGALVAERAFTVENDAFVADHAIGRAAPGGGFALPVLPFTLTLELLADAAALLGAPAVEIADARAHRWLALDGGRLDVTVRARLRGPVGALDAIEVAIDQAGERAADAVVLVGARPDRPEPLAPVEDPTLRPPADWSAARFYQELAFHGPSLQGLVEIDRVGERAIEAQLRVRAQPGLPHASLDGGLLDCAGQLVALWLLERGGRDFGLFPFAARRVAWFGDPPAPGARILGRARMTRDALGTDAEIDFTDERGVAIARLDGFRQRLVEFPAWFARLVLRGETDRVTLAAARRALDGGDEFLRQSSGIWGRVLAHLLLSPAEIAARFGGRERERKERSR